MEQNLLTSQQISYIFTNMEDAVCITKRNGTVLYMNKRAKKLWGEGAESNQERRIWDVIQFTECNDNLIQLFIDAVTQNKELHELVKYENNSGKIFSLHISMTYLHEDDGMFVIVARDLTEFLRVNSAFARYTSPEIAKYVLTTPEGEKQGGQTRDVTILMSDLRGFTAMSTKLSPDTLITILNHYFENMTAVIERYGGTVIEFLGDGIFVVFGAPSPDSNHAANAVSCAIEMENAMLEVNKWNVSNSFPELEMGIGINSGPAVVGNIGSNQKMKYGCMGETVNLAGRVETFTIGGQVYISERTKALISENLIISDEQSFMPKGAKNPMKIFAVEGIGDIHMTAEKEHNWKECRGREVILHKMEGKTVDSREYRAVITKISDDEHYAVFKSDIKLLKSQNVMFDIGGSLYAKVTKSTDEENSFTVCFTSKPDNFGDWLKQYS